MAIIRYMKFVDEYVYHGHFGLETEDKVNLTKISIFEVGLFSKILTKYQMLLTFVVWGHAILVKLCTGSQYLGGNIYTYFVAIITSK